MADNRLRDDEVFRTELNAVVDEVLRELPMINAGTGSMTGRDPNDSVVEGVIDQVTDFVHPDSYNPFDGKPYGNFEEFEEYFRERFKQFRGYNITGGTEMIFESLQLHVKHQFEDLIGGEHGESVISTALAEWNGDENSAGYRFHTEYLPVLGQSMENQLEIALSLTAIIKAHEAVVLVAREAILQIANNALNAAGQAREARDKANQQLINAVLQEAAGVLTGLGSGSVADLVHSAIRSVGDTVIATSLSVEGNDFIEVADAMEAAIRGLAESIKAEQELIRKALGHVMTSMTDYRLDYLPRDVNRPVEPVHTHGPY